MSIYLRKRGRLTLTPFRGRGYTSARPMAGAPDRDNPWRGYSTGLGISVTMVAGLAVWGAVGYLVDRLLGTSEVFTVLGMMAGAAGAGYLTYLRHGRGNDA
jgi:F0F1-type ATP synthase assembly protein I